MNQILFTNYKDLVCVEKKDKYFNNKKKYLILFIVSISICIIILSYLLYSIFLKSNEKYRTNLLKDKYSILTLYSSDTNYDTLKLSNNISIIGLIEIPKIAISYPILLESSEDLLKISVCRFSGPLPNRTGNLCIAGHNYKNNLMFSNLNKLEINDSIYITDLNNIKLEYLVYNKYKVKENNLTCTEGNNDVEITLITCNQGDNQERIIIKAKVKGK